jgi:hypothetical protein
MGSTAVIDSPTVLPIDYMCDGCSARAAYEVTLASGKSLLFCGHHTKRNMDSIVAQGGEVKELQP